MNESRQTQKKSQLVSILKKPSERTNYHSGSHLNNRKNRPLSTSRTKLTPTTRSRRKVKRSNRKVKFNLNNNSSDSKYQLRVLRPLPKKRKLGKQSMLSEQRMKHEKILRQILEKNRVSLENAEQNRFIEVDMCVNGAGYTIIKGDMDTYDGIRNTKKFLSKDRALKAASRLLAVKSFNQHI